mmetsp:Transcript_11733/g.20602  ORF Transcript_11733/g.20602 Transcript_11733/m.20602 type:complete len:206 (+) Transcript_11733:1227-1844(+)
MENTTRKSIITKRMRSYPKRTRHKKKRRNQILTIHSSQQEPRIILRRKGTPTPLQTFAGVLRRMMNPPWHSRSNPRPKSQRMTPYVMKRIITVCRRRILCQPHNDGGGLPRKRINAPARRMCKQAECSWKMLRTTRAATRKIRSQHPPRLVAKRLRHHRLPPRPPQHHHRLPENLLVHPSFRHWCTILDPVRNHAVGPNPAVATL